MDGAEVAHDHPAARVHLVGEGLRGPDGKLISFMDGKFAKDAVGGKVKETVTRDKIFTLHEPSGSAATGDAEDVAAGPRERVAVLIENAVEIVRLVHGGQVLGGMFEGVS